MKEDIGEVGPCYGGYSNVSIEFRNVDNRYYIQYNPSIKGWNLTLIVSQVPLNHPVP